MEYSKDISIIVPLLNEKESLPELVAWIKRVVEKEGWTYEIIMIDDGSTDGSWDTIKELSASDSSIHGIRFRRNYGKSAALFHGFKAAEGRVVFTMDADLQDSPDELPEMYRMVTEEDWDVVSGWKQHRQDNKLTKNLPSKLYNATARWITGIRLHDMNCGLKADTLVYDNKSLASSGRNREERSTRSSLALDTLIIFTNVLEKFSMLVSVILFSVMVIMFGWIVYSIFSTVRPVEGWMSLMTLISFGFFMMSVMLTLIFKYLSVILNMSFKRQRYVIEGVEKLTK